MNSRTLKRDESKPEGVMLSVVVPVFNEIDTVTDVLRRINNTPHNKEIIVVDDGSSDGTGELLAQLETSGQFPNVRILQHEINKGKGAALRTGMDAIKGDIVIIQDADLEYDPDDYSILVAPIVNGNADVVYGSRFLSGPHRVLFFWHSVGNKLLTLASNVFTDLNLTDMETGYKAFRADIVRHFTIEENRFGFEPEITAKVAKMGCRIYEVPISYHGRSYSGGQEDYMERRGCGPFIASLNTICLASDQKSSEDERKTSVWDEYGLSWKDFPLARSCSCCSVVACQRCPRIEKSNTKQSAR